MRWLPFLLAAVPALAMLPAASGAQAAGSVELLYDGSLVNLIEHGIDPAFRAASGDAVHGVPGGSRALATAIRGGQQRGDAEAHRGDVFISSDPALDEALQGAANGNRVRWWVRFAESPLVIGLNPTSRFAAEMRSKPWYEVLREPGIRIGRTDPKLDPKGALTLALLDRAAKLYHQSDLKAVVLGADANPAQVVPEAELVDRLQSGQLDAGFFYASETADTNIPVIPLPPEVSGAAAYTVTVLQDAPNPQAAVDFVAYLLGKGGGEVLRAHGMPPSPLQIGGDAQAVPAAIRALVTPPP